MNEEIDLLYMNWWVKDFLSDTTDMDAEESGAYMLLIGHCYLEGFIPTDRRKLLRISRLYDDDKLDVLESILDRYFHTSSNGLVNNRALRERDDAIERRRNASAAGRAGANARWKNQQSQETQPPSFKPPPKPPKETKHKHGEYQHVLLTDAEYNRLVDDWGEAETQRMIAELDEGIELKGYKYNSHNLALRKWQKKENGADVDREEAKRMADEVFGLRRVR
jgi:uncharacterized protein YdaU (DUF1376 family)